MSDRLRPAASDLGRFERMARRARMRAAIERDGRLNGAEQWTVQLAREECIQANRPEFRAGPPGGCAECYSWVRGPLGFWSWHHGPGVPEEYRRYRVWDYDEEIPHCMHVCHGRPGGLPLPVVAIG